MKPQVTEAHRALADKLAQLFWAAKPQSHEEASQLIADHEADLLARAEAAEAACASKNEILIKSFERLRSLGVHLSQDPICDLIDKAIQRTPAETRSVIAALREEMIAINARFLGVQDRLNQQVDKCSEITVQRDALITAWSKFNEDLYSEVTKLLSIEGNNRLKSVTSQIHT